MKSEQIENGFFLVFERGEEFMSSLASFCEEHELHWAQFSGVGAVENAEIGYYDLASRSYVFKKEAGPFEVVSLNGNVAELDESPLVHAHAAFSRCDESLATIGGHLKSAQVALTLEVWLSRVSQPLLRAPDPETGLNLITL